MSRVFSLLVGINDYPPEVGRLAGCLNDVDRFHDHLNRHVDRAGDAAVFHCCGHAARWASAAAFHDFHPDVTEPVTDAATLCSPHAPTEQGTDRRGPTEPDCACLRACECSDGSVCRVRQRTDVTHAAA